MVQDQWLGRIATTLAFIVATAAGTVGGSTPDATDAADADPTRPSPSAPAVSTDVGGVAIDVAHPLSPARLEHWPLHETREVQNVALGDGMVLDLQLERTTVLAPGAKVVLAGPNGDRQVDPPQVALLSGSVIGEPASRAFISASQWGVYGYIARGEDVRILSTGPYARPGRPMKPLRAMRGEDVPPGGGPFCAVEPGSPFARALALRGAAAAPPPPPGITPGTGVCRVARVAIETDYEYCGELFGGDHDAAAAYALTLLGASSELFTAEVNVRFLISFLRLWSDPADPYQTTGASARTNEFSAEWTASMSDVPRDVAHMFSGAGLGGGAAWLQGLCTPDESYAVSGNLNGFFPYPFEDHDHNNWDIVVVTHEFGHIFGTAHTHNYDPPLDGCGIGDCSTAHQGTIMSYCHQCDGGLSNIALEFHPQVAETILTFLDSTCDLSATLALQAVDDQTVAYESVPTEIDVLLNDLAEWCPQADGVEITAFDEQSAQGGAVELVTDTLLGRDMLRYTPPAGFAGMDAFGYTIEGGPSATVTVDVQALRAADGPSTAEPGLAVSYYTLAAPEVLPDFDTLDAYATDVATTVNYASTDGGFATSGRAEEVGAVFEGYLVVPVGGVYTLYTESDDGSALSIGEALIVENDGLHPMVEQAGQIALAPGAHALRIEFFEAFGGAGLIASIAGPGLPKTHIPADMLGQSLGCAADLAGGNATVDVADLLALLNGWGGNNVGAALAPPADTIDVADLLELLSAWGACTD